MAETRICERQGVAPYRAVRGSSGRESSLNGELYLLTSPGMKCMALRPLNSNAISSLGAGLRSDCFRATDNSWEFFGLG